MSAAHSALSANVVGLFHDFVLELWRHEVDHKSHADLIQPVVVDQLISGVTLDGCVTLGSCVVTVGWGIQPGQGFADNFEGVDDVPCKGIEVLEGVRPLTDAKDGVNEKSGVLHVAAMTDHFLLEVGPCLLVGGFVEHCPVVSFPLGAPKQGCRGFCVGCFI